MEANLVSLMQPYLVNLKVMTIEQLITGVRYGHFLAIMNVLLVKKQGFFVTVRAGTAYRHLFPSKEKSINCNVYC